MRYDIWDLLDELIALHPIILDRPKGSHHPRFPEIEYPLDYGFLDGTKSSDGHEIDLYCGSLENRQLNSILLTVDSIKKDIEIKLLLGCTESEISTALDHANFGKMRAMLIRRERHKEEFMELIPATHQDLLEDGTKAFLFLATLMSDGSPQVTPIWFNTDGEHILINSAKGRVKDRNMRSRNRVALCILDPRNPYRYIQIHGTVVEITEESADEHIDALAFKYLGKEHYPSRQPGEKRVKYIVKIDKVDAHG